METCRRNFFYLPIHSYHKFRSVANESPGGYLNNQWLFDEQRASFLDGWDRNPRVSRLSRGLFGQRIETVAEMNAWIDTHYGEIAWLDNYTDRWLAVVNKLRFPDEEYENEEYPMFPIRYPGVPFYFLAAAGGLILVAFRRGTLQPFHIAWGLTMLAFFYTIILTANVRSRFRYVFEPFWFIYITIIADTIWVWVRGTRERLK
jgi:hypothetical protein